MRFGATHHLNHLLIFPHVLQLRYNRKASPIGWFPIKEGDGMNLLYGFNNWKGGGKVQLKRIPAPSAKDLPALKPKAPKSWREQVWGRWKSPYFSARGGCSAEQRA